MTNQWIVSALLMWAITATAEPVAQRHSVTHPCLTSANVWDRYGSDELAKELNDEIINMALEKGLQLTDVRLTATGQCNYYYTRPRGTNHPSYTVEMNSEVLRTHWVSCNDDLRLPFGEELQSGQIETMNSYEVAEEKMGFHLVRTLEPQAGATFCTQIYVKNMKAAPVVSQRDSKQP